MAKRLKLAVKTDANVYEWVKSYDFQLTSKTVTDGRLAHNVIDAEFCREHVISFFQTKHSTREFKLARTLDEANS